MAAALAGAVVQAPAPERPIARHWAIIATLIQTAKLNGHDPLAWLADVLERIISRRTKHDESHTLLPCNWKTEIGSSAASSV